MLHKKALKAHDLSERQQRIYEFLHDNNAGVLASLQPNGEPHGSVVYQTTDKSFNVSFLTKTGTQKYENIANNNHVVMIIFDQSTQTTAQVVGKAFEIRDRQKINDVAAAVFMASLKTSQGGVPPIAKMNVGEYTAFRIEPDQIKLARFGRPDSGDNALFESVESFELNHGL